LKTIQTLELPETEADLVYLQLLHQGRYYDHIVDRIKDWMLDSILFGRESSCLESFVTWLVLQHIVPINILASPNDGIRIVFGIRNAVLNIGHLDYAWYTQIVQLPASINVKHA
jgi:hypothetical protein